MKELRQQERAFQGLALMALEAEDFESFFRRLDEALALAAIRAIVARNIKREGGRHVQANQ